VSSVSFLVLKVSFFFATSLFLLSVKQMKADRGSLSSFGIDFDDKFLFDIAVFDVDGIRLLLVLVEVVTAVGIVADCKGVF